LLVFSFLIVLINSIIIIIAERLRNYLLMHKVCFGDAKNILHLQYGVLIPGQIWFYSSVPRAPPRISFARCVSQMRIA
jgi:hypothetical protein